MTQNLRVAELDFDTIKTNLKAYLSSKPGFTDHNFEGSGLSLMLDVLAYNTHYNAVIANMLTQEMFIDSAVKRTTVGMHAKRMGYLPRSMRAARSFVDVEVFPDVTPDTLTLGKNAVFTSSGQLQFNFITLDSMTILPDNQGRYLFKNVPIYEGSLTTFKYVVDSLHQKFTIPSRNVDTTLLKVTVQKSLTNTDRTSYTYHESVIDIDGETNAYYLKTNEEGLYEVYFGDGVLGRQIEVGNMVILEYVVCSADVPNGATGFQLNDSIQGFVTLTVTTLNRAFGGAVEESIMSIKDNAYKRMLAQNRAVTANDYTSVINSIIPVGDASVWGGEDNVPPVYGKVFISLIPIDINAQFDQTTKNFILEQLRSKMTVTIVPELVDPDYTYIGLESSVYYDPYKTGNTAEQIKTLVSQRLAVYTNDRLNKFNSQFRYSNLVAYIDDTDKSIMSNITKVSLSKEWKATLGLTTTYVIDYKNPIKKGSLKSGAFLTGDYAGYVNIDDLDGAVRIYYLNSGVKTVVKTIGAIDYTTGRITIDPIYVIGYSDSMLMIHATPLSNDVLSVTNDVLILRASDIDLTVLDGVNKGNYIFTNSA
jgi:hypothetical protein